MGLEGRGQGRAVGKRSETELGTRVGRTLSDFTLGDVTRSRRFLARGGKWCDLGFRRSLSGNRQS